MSDLTMPTSKQYKTHLDSMPNKELKSHYIPQNYRSSSDKGYQKQYCTLDSSLTNSNYITSHDSPPTISFSPTSGSPNFSDNTYGSCISEDPNDFHHKLKELENEMLGDADNQVDSIQNNFQNHFSLDTECLMDIMGIPRGDLKQALLACAQAVSENEMSLAELLITEVRQMVSVSGEPVQRLGAYMLEGLIARLASSGSSIYKALKCKEPLSSDLLSYMHLLYEACPYFKFGYLSANGAIAEAFKGEDKVHIIDFQIAQGTQWVSLIQALAKRPGGPPHVKITGIDDNLSSYARGGGLHIVGQRLSHFANSCGVPFEFFPAITPPADVHNIDLHVRAGEALAVNFAFQLHHIPDESVSTMNPRDQLLRLVKSLNPKVVTLVEQESNTNTTPFFPRFVETLTYYTAIFESIDVKLPREDKERINVEQHCLARDIVNIIACEGGERVERHELLGKWKARFYMAGFSPIPLSPLVNATIKSLLGDYSKSYSLEERDGALYLGWMGRTLVTSSAWR